MLHIQAQNLSPKTITVENIAQVKMLQRIGFGVSRDIDWAPDGKQIAIASAAGVQIRNAESLELVNLLNFPQARLVKFSHSNSGLWVFWHETANSTQERFGLIDIDTGQVLLDFSSELSSTYRLVLSADGELIALGYRDGINIYEAISRRKLQSIVLKGLWESSFVGVGFAIRSDAKELVVLNRNEILVHDLGDGKKVWQVAIGDEAGFRHLAVSPNGSKAIAADDLGQLVVIDLNARSSHKLPSSHVGAVHRLSWSSDDTRFAASSYDGMISIWDAVTQTQALQFESGSRVIAGLAFGRQDNALVSVSLDGEIIRWDTSTGSALASVRGGLTTTIAPRVGFAYNADKQILATGSGGAITVWDLSTSSLLWRFVDQHGLVSSLAISSNGRYLASASDARNFQYNQWVRIKGKPIDQVVVWDLSTGKVVFVDSDLFRGVAFAPDNKTLIACSQSGLGNSVAVSVGTWKVRGPITLPCTSAMAFNRAGTRIASWGGVDTFPGTSPRFVYQTSLNGETFFIPAAFSPNGKLAAHGGKGKVLVCDATLPATERLPVPKCPNRGSVLEQAQPSSPYLSFSPDSKILLASSSLGQLHIYDVESDADISVLDFPGQRQGPIGVFNKLQTEVIVVRADGIIEIWGLDNS